MRVPHSYPFDGYRVAITDPDAFFGRDELLRLIRSSPFTVRVLLGGRRVGKTSLLRALEWHCLDRGNKWERRPFPVFINFELEQPEGVDNLRYILIARLREAIARWEGVSWTGLRRTYAEFLAQVAGAEATVGFLKLKVINPAYERRLNHEQFRHALTESIKELREKHDFEGVCYALDEAEFVVRKPWANDAWSYIRGLKDSDIAIKPFLGVVLAGYRRLREYQQAVGSPLLNIAEVNWLGPLKTSDVVRLVRWRAEVESLSVSDADCDWILEWAGCHAYLTQQAVNLVLDRQGECAEALVDALLGLHHKDFSAWWNVGDGLDGMSSLDREVYRVVTARPDLSRSGIARATSSSLMRVRQALDLLVGTGVLRRADDDSTRLLPGSRLFQLWVAQMSDSAEA
jgi:hypothetical protein